MGLTERELCPRWYALAVKHQHERRVGTVLHTRGLETLVPVYRTRRVWSDRVKDVELPLFPGYVFCQFTYLNRNALLNTPGVKKIVGFGSSPAPLEDREISAIQTVLRSRFPVRPWPYLNPGDRVVVKRGALRGLEGVLLKEKDSFKLLVSVELLRRSIVVEIEPDMIVPARMLCASA
jgi:transcription antitermination factor NusG